MTLGARVPRLPTPKPYVPRSHAVIIGSHVPTVLTPGLVSVPAPALPKGHQIKCTWCRCSVPTTHQPGSYDCLEAAHERTTSQADA